LRGGANDSSAKVVRAAFRNYEGAGSIGNGSYGFRVMCGVKARMD
jgi:formylglycine-generating enzyme required for sulfatase activity